MTPRYPVLRRWALVLALVFSPALLLGQARPTASIEGRVQDIGRGDYLRNARVTVEGTTLFALTNEFGEYRIADVPAGAVRLTAFYSGLPAVTQNVNASAGERIVRDFELRAAPAAGDVVKMEAFTVSTSREMSQSAIATNEQRFAPNMKTVLSAEEFGEQSENNVAEFLKLMPAVEISYVDQDARAASLRGLPTYATVVTANGNQVASAASSGANRDFEFEQISMNEVARVEVNKTLVPDMPAEGIGGTINLITKSAFERSRPSFNSRGYFNFNTTALDFKQTPGPFREETYKIRPGFDFTYINPLTKNFGVTVSGSYSSKFNPQYYADPTWNLNLDRNTGIENPFISTFNAYDGPKSTERDSARVSFDWRFARHDVLSVGFSEQYYRALIGNRRFQLTIGSSPAEITSDHVTSRAGAGSEYMGLSMNDKSGTTWTPEIKYVHNGPIWLVEAGGAYSHAGNDYYASDKGFFSGVNLSLNSLNAAGNGYVGPTLRFDYTGNYLPETKATLANGTVVNPRDATQLTLDSASALRRKSVDLKKTFRAIAQRNFNIGVPLRVRFGGDIREAVRDIREVTPSWTFVGPDGIRNSADNFTRNYDIVDERYSTVDQKFGQPRIRWFDPYKIYELYRQHPNWWTIDEAALHNNLVDKSKFLTETVTSGFLRFDTQFFRNRLLLTGGWRYQQYKVYSESGEVNTLGKYLTDTEGNLVMDPVTNKPITLPGNALAVAENTNIERGVVGRSKRGGWYPSLNTTFRITDSLQFRASYADSINYPQLSEILGVTNISDYSVTTPTVFINKPLKPWKAHNYDLELEYFTPQGGSMSASWWRKEMTGFIATATYYDDEADARLREFGYEALIPLNYRVQQKFNAGTTTMEGFELALRQTLDPWVPGWARGFNVFANTSYKAAPHIDGPGSIDVSSRRSINWGTSYRRGRFSTTLKFNYLQEPKRRYSSSDTHPMTRTFTDADVAVRLTKHLSFFASGTNIFGVATETFVYDEATPVYARRRAHHFYGVQCIAGIKGQF